MKPQLLTLLFLALGATGSMAQDAGEIKNLERKIGVLADEIERLKLGSAAAEPEKLESIRGFGPAASKIYKKGAKRVSVGGYGELVYQNFQPKKQNGTGAGKRDQFDLLRAIIYVGYNFNDWITFNSEIEFEHANEGKRGEVGVEFAQIDLTPFGNWLGLRGGLLLVPMGLVNEIHEPTTFHGVLRPSVERNILPTTWRENGFGVFGNAGWFEYRSYIMAGLQAVTDGGGSPAVSGFNASSGIRNGRQKGSKAFSEDLAWVTRVDVSPVDWASGGFSIYTGEADQSALSAPSIPVTFWDLHGQVKYRGAELRALYTEGRIGNVDELNVLQNNTAAGSPTASVGQKLFGGYLEVAYDVGQWIPQMNNHYLAPFIRYERYDTQKEVPAGWRKDPSNSRVEYTVGLTYRPVPQVAIKADHQFLFNQGQTGVGQTNFGFGYIF